ncbi:MAG: PF13754 domain-containing protein [Clostridiales bacterium]
MVTQLIGKADGKDIIFNLIDEAKGLWETAVPLDLDGTYVVDLTAWDDAGNSSYCATVLFAVDPEKLHISLKVLKYRLGGVEHGYDLQNLKLWEVGMVNKGYDLILQKSGYHLERGHLCEL